MWQIFKLLLKNFFGLKKSKRLYKRIIFPFSSVLIGILIGYLLNEAGDGLLTKSSDELITFLLTALFLLPFLRIIFPAYRPLRRIVLSYYPVSHFNKMIINLIIDMLSGFFIFLFIFLLTLSIISKDFNIKFLIQSYLLVISSHLLRTIVQNLIENRYNLRSFILINIMLIMILIISLFRHPFEPSNFNWTLIIFGLSVFILLLIESTVPFQTRSAIYLKRLPVKNIFWQLIIYNKGVRMSLIIGLIVKIVFFISDILFVKRTGRHIMDGNLLYWIFIAAPTIHFSYVFNNLWGNYRFLWLHLKLHFDNDWHEYFITFYKIIFIPLLIDMVISLIFLIILWNNKVFVISYYLLSLVFLCCFSIYWSFVCPAYLTDSAIFNIAHSPKGNFICLVVTGFLYLMKINSWFYLLAPFLIVISVSLLLKLRFDIKMNKWDVYLPLFSE